MGSERLAATPLKSALILHGQDVNTDHKASEAHRVALATIRDQEQVIAELRSALAAEQAAAAEAVQAERGELLAFMRATQTESETVEYVAGYCYARIQIADFISARCEK